MAEVKQLRLSKNPRAKGIYAVYKPKGPTSHDIVDRLRKETGVKKIGHAGTLDPLASGVLVVGVGREATKKLSQIVKKEKEYLARIRLGMTSATDDEEGEKLEVLQKHHAPASRNCKDHRISLPGIPNFEEVQKVVAKFEGKILQTPPIYSAVKVKGQEAYKLARRGQTPNLKPREVEIKEIEILKYEWPYLHLRVVTGPGVYIRSLARDIGELLKTGGYLADLERIRVGDFAKTEAIPASSVDAPKRCRTWIRGSKFLCPRLFSPRRRTGGGSPTRRLPSDECWLPGQDLNLD